MPNTELQDILLRQAIVTTEQVRLAVAATLGTTTTWLEHLLLTKQLDEETVARAVGERVRAPSGDLDRLAKVPRDVLAQLPRDLAVEHRMVPLWLEPDGDLRVGMVDPSDTGAVEEVEFFLGRRVLREVVPATALAWALSTYYGASSVLWPPQEASQTFSRPSQRMARGSVQPPLSGELELAYDVEVSSDADDSVEILGRAIKGGDLLVEVTDAPTGRLEPKQRRYG